MLERDFQKDDLPPLEVDDEVELELEKTVAERQKLNHRKKNMKEQD